jgi:hypothetical protein
VSDEVKPQIGAGVDQLAGDGEHQDRPTMDRAAWDRHKAAISGGMEIVGFDAATNRAAVRFQQAVGELPEGEE